MAAVIKVENLSKRYIIGHQANEKYGTMRDAITRGASELIRWPVKFMSHKSGDMRKTTEAFWAVNDVSFEINQGERVGIIGRNGAGKSTLLKLLSRITEPTRGRILINGRVSSLLEVGTGFHPELTGRENIFLNGAILGMRRADILSGFDEIVAFAEVEKFLDTPVKRYSSGMYVRLAFAVAAHLEPDILIVDEVLAVGDAAFQKKCLGKMEDIGDEGRTVLFVSHNMAAISKLTSHCVLLNNGKVELFGNTEQVIQKYIGGSENVFLSKRRPIEDILYIKRWTNSDAINFKEIGLAGAVEPNVFVGGELNLEIVFVANKNIENVRIGYGVSSDGDFKVMGGFSPMFEVKDIGRNICMLTIKNLNLAPGTYSLDLSIGTGSDELSRTDYDAIQGVGSFHVIPYEKDLTPIGEWARGWGMTINSSSNVKYIDG